MDKTIVERALSALAEIGAARSPVARLPSEMPDPADLAPAALCGSPDCAGCYDIGEGRKIHPPRVGEG